MDTSITNQQWAACYERGLRLARIEKDHDYAHAMFSECLTHDPGNLSYVEALIGNLKDKFGGDKKRACHLFGLTGRRAFKKAVSARDWFQVLRLGVDLLKSNPWHVATLHSMAQACQELHLNEVELVYLKQALEAAPKDVEVNRHCAQSLARMGQFDQAIACWHRVEEITSGNAEAAQMIAKLAEEKIHHAGKRAKDGGRQKERQEAGAAPANSHPGIIDTAEIIRPQVSDMVQLTPRQRLEKAIRDDPADVRGYLELSQLLCGEGSFEKAESLLSQALHNCAQVSLVQDALRKAQAAHANAVREAVEIERQKQLRAQGKPFRMPWLELVLIGAGAMLLLQIFPSWWTAMLSTLAAHKQVFLIVLNVVVLVALIGWRRWKR